MKGRQPSDNEPTGAPVLYAIRDVVDRTGVPAYQLRRWERELPGFILVVRTQGGQRRYTEASIERIRQLERLVNGEGLSLVGARRRIEEGAEPEGEPALADRLLRDKRVLQAIDQLADLVRRKIFEEMGVPVDLAGTKGRWHAVHGETHTRNRG